ncbi:formyl transferase [Aliikangiella marina]|uniref:Formyl transferase n=1 Tax=Aliikangiella marina TaxID=1712262 RepID=A0A545T551_9GAMM|nr:formyl transferase [Aliikangiella marina]TQV72346.1 formyl transferase [Aliikangiella marina]
MKLVILANKDIASNIALNYLVRGLKQHIIRIFLSDHVGAQSKKPKALLDLKFFEQDLFNQIVFPNIDNQETNNNPANSNSANSQLKTFHQLARESGHELATLNDINQVTGLEKLTAEAPDLILSVRFGKILKSPAIATAKLGVINLHSGLLPEYQGVMATFWAMYNQASHYGSTLHFIDSAAIDAGPIINRNTATLDYSKSYLENVLALYETGCDAMIEAVTQLSSGQALNAQPQQGKAEYFTFPTDNQLQTFFERGLTLFDTNHIIQLVKAYQGDE